MDFAALISEMFGNTLDMGQGVGISGVQVWPLLEESEVALCWTQLVPASSTVDPPQDTAEPISKAGGTSEKTFRKGCRLSSDPTFMKERNKNLPSTHEYFSEPLI
ncbi:hypothetical protein AV530_000301 [Patagioenas fasciata monilis]|uniref:Uncharacterized protein n=1 Tax=Patagioenas fasciata monilis TaxID=372326 RepID=A0A1V4KDC0_PATFA|nr:hypothetical protein AV530_000301 [Patagioenas fasciata monilis]